MRSRYRKAQKLSKMLQSVVANKERGRRWPIREIFILELNTVVTTKLNNNAFNMAVNDFQNIHAVGSITFSLEMAATIRNYS